MILPAVTALVALAASAREGDVALDLSKAINDGHAPQCFKPGERDAAGVKFRIVDPSKDGRLGYVAFADIRSPKRPVSVTVAPSAPTEGELNGLMTYDRVLKFDAEMAQAASESLLK